MSKNRLRNTYFNKEKIVLRGIIMKKKEKILILLSYPIAKIVSLTVYYVVGFFQFMIENYFSDNKITSVFSSFKMWDVELIGVSIM